MKFYSVFDDFDSMATDIIRNAGFEIVIHPMGQKRPEGKELQKILEEYDGIIIGTGQKMPEWMFENINTTKIIATASVGMDHVRIPEEKKDLITYKSTPGANAISVAEYTMGAALNCCRRIEEGVAIYRQGKNNKALRNKPTELYEKIIGVIGAGNIARMIIRIANSFGMTALCWTAHPERHPEIEDIGAEFVTLEDIALYSDIISVNLPDAYGTRGIIDRNFINIMKQEVIFISVSRLSVLDARALKNKVVQCPNCYVCMDIDLDSEIVDDLAQYDNVYITPHIAGGTIESRVRMFRVCAQNVVNYGLKNNTI